MNEQLEQTDKREREKERERKRESRIYIHM